MWCYSGTVEIVKVWLDKFIDVLVMRDEFPNGMEVISSEPHRRGRRQGKGRGASPRNEGMMSSDAW